MWFIVQMKVKDEAFIGTWWKCMENEAEMACHRVKILVFLLLLGTYFFIPL